MSPLVPLLRDIPPIVPSIEVESVGFRDLRGRFTKATTEMMNERVDFFRSLGRRMVSLARAEAPKRTGEYARGFTFVFSKKKSDISGQLITPEPLTKWIVRGTKAHNIRPIERYGPRGLPISFGSKYVGSGYGGKIMFFGRVRHPGTKANPFLDRVVERLDPEIATYLSRLATRWTISFTATGQAGETR